MTKVNDPKVPGLFMRKGKTKDTYYLHYKDRQGKRRTKAIGNAGIITKEDARAKATHILRQVSMGELLSSEKTFEDCYSVWKDTDAKRLKYNTIHQYEGLWSNYLKDNIGQAKISSVTACDLEEVKELMPKVTANRALSFVNVLYKQAKRKGWWTGDAPSKHVRSNTERSRKRHLTSDEFKRFGSTVRQWKRSYDSDKHQFAHLVMMYLYSGMRRNELLNLRFCDVDYKNRKLTLPDTKTEANRVIVYTDQFDAELKRMHSFRYSNKKVFDISNVDRLWREFKDSCDISNLTLHDLRRSFATVGFSEGLSLDQVGKVLGHRNSSSTQRYAHLMNEQHRAIAGKACDKIEEMLG